MPKPIVPEPVRLRMAQFSTVNEPTVLTTMPLPPPKPIPLMVSPRRLTLSPMVPLMVMR